MQRSVKYTTSSKRRLSSRIKQLSLLHGKVSQTEQSFFATRDSQARYIIPRSVAFDRSPTDIF